MQIDIGQLQSSLRLLNERLSLRKSAPIRLVVCGGSALIATKLVSRTTKDVDIVARFDDCLNLIDPEPLPDELIEEAEVVAKNYNLPKDWINCGPSDLFRMGLPVGFVDRLIENRVGDFLTVYFISRFDQIHFKLYASVDRGGYHIDDLLNLNPTTDELIQSAKWTMTHDVSEGYAMMLKELLTQLGYGDAAREV